MQRSPLENSSGLAAHPVEPRGTRAQLRQTAVDSVHQVNAQLLDLLCAAARGSGNAFPFNTSLRARFASLTVAQCETLACCGTLLVDAGFSDPDRWQRARALEVGSNEKSWRSNAWSHEDAVLIGHSTIFVAWSVLHGARAEAGVLLGISPETASIITGMDVSQLSRTAQRHPDWILPRWLDRSIAWSNLIDFAVDAGQARSRIGALRCLQLNGGHAAWLASHFDGRP